MLSYIPHIKTRLGGVLQTQSRLVIKGENDFHFQNLRGLLESGVERYPLVSAEKKPRAQSLPYWCISNKKL